MLWYCREIVSVPEPAIGRIITYRILTPNFVMLLFIYSVLFRIRLTTW